MSDDRISVVLFSWPQAWQAFKDTSAWAKAMILAGHRLVLEIRPENRSDKQNRLLHSRLGDVAKACQWAGAKRDVDTWRRLFTSAWLRTQNQHVEVLPALDGHGVDIVYASTTKLSRKACAELSEYILFWGSEQGVEWCAASLPDEAPAEAAPPQRRRAQAVERGDVDPATGEILAA